MTQADEIVAAARAVLGDALLGAYLHGSAVLGGLAPGSDVDVLVVSSRRLAQEEKRRLFESLIAITRQPRTVELTVVVQDDVRPWRYPPRLDFQYGEWLRLQFVAGVEEPWEDVDPDLATLLTIVLRCGETLAGPPPSELLDPVPHEDLVRALTETLSFTPTGDDVRNGLLTLARIWTTLATGEIVRKDVAAAWVLERADLPLLARARDLYLAGERGEWDAEEAQRTAEVLLRGIQLAEPRLFARQNGVAE
jgi:predicted nucleotidyltransferase